MTPTQPHRWAIYRDPAGLDVVRTGTAASITDAWIAALAVGRAVLIDGTVTDLAVAVDDAFPSVLYSPARDESGRVDAAAVTRAFVDIVQGQTAALVAEQLVRR
ncbi:hypothetical protein [Pseudonocardia sp.]|uniref:hypothetical protein n=1 Tax=Pseudonocardia sp. TaxID=60912 RepID=UPI003D09762F